MYGAIEQASRRWRGGGRDAKLIAARRRLAEIYDREDHERDVEAGVPVAVAAIVNAPVAAEEEDRNDNYLHIRHIGNVPFIERLVEGSCFIKHTIHILHFVRELHWLIRKSIWILRMICSAKFGRTTRKKLMNTPKTLSRGNNRTILASRAVNC